MITPTMTHDEVWKHVLSCKERFVSWVKYRTEDWHKIEKKKPKNWYGGITYEWFNRQINLRILSVHTRLKVSGYGQGLATFVPVDTERGTHYYRLHHIPRCIYIYTAHYIKRYAERMGFINDIYTLLPKLESRNPVLINIYEEKETNRCVYAIRDGIILAEYDPKRNVNILRTFVSNAMLGETQRRAHEIVSRLTPIFDEAFGKLHKNGSTAAMNLLMPEIIKSFREEASAVYASYWESE